MIRAAGLAAAALALAACVGFTRPSPQEQTASLDSYFTRDAPWKDWPAKLVADDPAFRGARFTPSRDCTRVGAYVVCKGRFTLADGADRPVKLWLVRQAGQWRLMDIVPENANL